MDVVVPLGIGSMWENNELRYSLRSLEMYGRGVDRVFVVGACPAWLQNVIHIPFADKFGHERNIVNKFLAACKDERVSDNFLMWNDDFFLTKETDFTNYPNYENGTLQKPIDKRIKNDGYRIALENTQDFLKQHNKFTLMHDIHCPMIYNKKKFIELMEKVDWEKKKSFVIKSLYANYYALPITFMEDLKFFEIISKIEIKNKIKDRHIFSVADTGLFRDMKETLKELYPNPSKYEK